jgi:hypothetical protein
VVGLALVAGTGKIFPLAIVAVLLYVMVAPGEEGRLQKQ